MYEPSCIVLCFSSKPKGTGCLSFLTALIVATFVAGNTALIADDVAISAEASVVQPGLSA